MIDYLKKPYMPVLLFIFLRIFAGIFSLLTGYDNFKSIVLFVIFPILILISLLAEIPKVWKIIAFLLSFTVLYLSLKSSAMSFYDYIYLIALIICLVMIYYSSEIRKKKQIQM